MGSKAIFSMAVAMAIWFMAISGAASAAGPETIYIAEGGHYAAGPFSSWGSMELWVNMTVLTGDPVDIYIMTMTQYVNSYPTESKMTMAVSYKNASVENVTAASIRFTLESSSSYSYDYSSESIFVVVDNRHCALTPGDADPTGPVTVLLEVDMVGDDFGFYDYGFDGYSILLCMVAPLVAVIIIIALMFLAMRRGNRAAQPPPLPPPFSMPPQQPPGPPGP